MQFLTKIAFDIMVATAVFRLLKKETADVLEILEVSLRNFPWFRKYFAMSLEAFGNLNIPLSSKVMISPHLISFIPCQSTRPSEF
jgi:hypothetical protein